MAGVRVLCEQTVDAYRRLFGDQHSRTLDSMNNLAVTLRALKDLAGACSLYEQMVDTRCRLLGEEHPHTLTSMEHLALTLYELGDLVDARALQEQTLDARRRVLGEEHPDACAAQADLDAIIELGDDPERPGDELRGDSITTVP